MSLSENDLQYGAHSACQKALRRGDLNLAKTSFDLLWGNKTHRDWFKWRLPILVEEDAWHMIGEYAKFTKSLPVDDEERAYRKFYYNLVLGLKSKDTEGLLYVAMSDHKTDHPEVAFMRKHLGSFLSDEQSIFNATEIAFEQITYQYGDSLSEYETDAIRALRRRINQGGMLGDRQSCIACMVLIGMRGLKEPDVDKVQGEYVQALAPKKKPRTIKIPWYCFDFHTALGKMALNIFLKRKSAEYANFNEADIKNLWFMFESGLVPNSQIRYKPEIEHPTCFDTIWWPVHLKRSVTMHGKSAKQMKTVWHDSMVNDIRGIVEWCIERRSE